MWQSVYSCFRRWTQLGLWQSLLTRISAQRDDEYLLIDSTCSRVHQHAAGPVGGQLAQAMGRSKASLSTKIHLACDALGYPLGFILTGANVSDFDQCKPLLKSHLRPNTFAIMDKGYERHRIENLFAKLKAFRRIATRYEKLHSTFAAMLSLACILIWLKS